MAVTDQKTKIPVGWTQKQLGELFFERPKSRIKVEDAFIDGQYPFFTSGEKVLSRNEYLTDGENLFLATGGVANVKFYNGNASHSSDTYCISTKENNTKLFFYHLQHKLAFINYHFFEGSGLKHLQKNAFKKFKIGLPEDIKEQQKIAEILTTIDETIDKTETLIQKYQRIKQGLMQDLLTKGIDENGNIRSEKTHKFKDSPLGRIPEEWKVVLMEQIYQEPIRDFGSFSSTKIIDFLNDGILFIKSEMIEEGGLNLTNRYYISEKVHRLLKKSYVKKGNILFSKIGSALGKAMVYDGSYGECNSNAASAKIQLNNELAENYYITYFLNYSVTQNRLKNLIISLLPRINLGDISSFQIILPPKVEQSRIATILFSADELIKKEEKYKHKLLATKRGLMEDLLTGSVRVNGLIN